MKKPSTKGMLKGILSDDLERVHIDITDKAVEWAVAGFIDEANNLLEQLWAFKIPHSGHLWLPDEGLQIMWQLSGKLPAGIPFGFKDVEEIEQENWSRHFNERKELAAIKDMLKEHFGQLEDQELLFNIENAGHDQPEKPEDHLAALKRDLKEAQEKGYSVFPSTTRGALLAARNDWHNDAEYFITWWGKGHSTHWSSYTLAFLMRDRKSATYLLSGILAPVFNLTSELCKSETEEIISALSKRMASGRSLVYGSLTWTELLGRISSSAIEQKTFDFSNEILSRRTLSRPPATEEEISTAEKRLGVRLPDDYKDFLLSSNGLEQYVSTGVSLVSVDRVDFLINVDKELVDIWTESIDDPVFSEKFRNSIIIGGHDDEQELLIVPLENGDSECWEFATWRPGETIYPSFRYYMEEQLQWLEDELFKD